MKKYIVLSIFIWALNYSNAQTLPSILQDYNGTSGSDPRFVNKFLNTLIYNSTDQIKGTEMQICDGTELGTKFFAELSAGTGNTYIKSSIVFNNKLYFTAQVTSTSNEYIYVLSNLTSTPQVLTTKAIGATNFSVINNKLFFSANMASGESGFEPWVTDGTDLGTKLLKDISAATASSYPGYFTELNGKAIFSCAGQLYTSDGTISNTILLKTINPTGSANPVDLKLFKGKIFFQANNGTSGTEIWTTDGTNAGTTIFKDINPASGNSNPFNFFVFNNELYFHATNGTNGTTLWKSDGTGFNTNMVKVINSSGNTIISDFCVYNNNLYFFANDGIHGNEIWSTDGTSAGTTLFYDLNPGPIGCKSTDIGGNNFITFGNRLFFRATDGTNGDELFSTAGKFTDLKKHKPDVTSTTDPLSSFAHSFQIVNNVLVFQANYNSNGLELWSIKEGNVGVYDAQTNPIVIYPNPTNTNYINVNIENVKSYSIFALTGKNIVSGILKAGQNTINLKNISNGVYLLNIANATHKIIINK